MIPKVINYVWLGGKQLPDNAKRNIESWHQTNPDYEIHQVNESNCNLQKYQFVRDAYEAGNWAFASDVVRLDTIYHNGGFYFDTDVKLVKSLDQLQEYNSFWALENSGLVNSGLGFGANAGDKNIKNLLAIYRQTKYDNNPDNWYDLITTNIISRYFQENGLKRKNKNQLLKGNTLVLSTPYFAPYHWWGGGKVRPQTIGIQQYDNSWGNSNDDIGLYRRFKHNLQLKLPGLFFGIIDLHKKLQGIKND